MTHSALDQLKSMTTIVADSSDLSAIEKFRPLDATTNPSLITAAANQPENRALIENAFAQAKAEGYANDELIERTIDILTVKLGAEILKLIKGRVSTEVDAALSYDTEATIAKAKELLALYKQYGIEQNRILIKIASTWEGIQAAKALEAEGVHCNLTLLFGLHQAQACAEAGVTLISPFVGRILDWYKKAENVSSYPVEQDPGVLSVKQIYHYYKQRSVKTEIMGASFRSIDQVLGLAGCDLLTVAPNLLAELEQDTREVQLQLSEKQSQASSEQLFDTLDRESFKALLEHDLMAFQLLQSGVDGFIKAREQLSTLLRQSFGYDAEIQA
ncbi:transaldolase [Acinetobacter sp. WCHAc010034]|uniref:transaldolase n=1 Tax=Acinetobacter sp. WCHAc010034 TaxID=1879049 RepID=UPI00083AEFEA|nr:transaldolase [Acinetobacter sp. WCHAc010034]AYA02014.1 transaldolase [Acinetobacter sp. WCHAc010034]